MLFFLAVSFSTKHGCSKWSKVAVDCFGWNKRTPHHRRTIALGHFFSKAEDEFSTGTMRSQKFSAIPSNLFHLRGSIHGCSTMGGLYQKSYQNGWLRGTHMLGNLHLMKCSQSSFYQCQVSINHVPSIWVASTAWRMWGKNTEQRVPVSSVVGPCGNCVFNENGQIPWKIHEK